MKSHTARGCALPIFVFFTLTCTSLFQAPAQASQSCVNAVSTLPVTHSLKYQPGEFKLRVATFNMENLSIDPRALKAALKGVRIDPSQKAESFKTDTDIQGIQKQIIEMNADIIGGQEIFTEADGNYVTESHPLLKGKYTYKHIEGNDGRGIDVGVWIKNSLLEIFDVSYETHKDVTWNGSDKLFSRDFPILLLTPKGWKNPVLAFGVTHNKSMRPSEGDPTSFKQRSAQILEILNIMDRYHGELGPALEGKAQFKSIFVGDMNADVMKAQETKPIRESQYKNAALVAETDVEPAHELWTHAYFQNNGKPHFKPIDGIFVSKGVRVINYETVDYIDANGKRWEQPKSFKHRKDMTSDHKPSYADIIF